MIVPSWYHSYVSVMHDRTVLMQHGGGSKPCCAKGNYRVGTKSC